MATAGTLNVIVDQGADWRRDIVLTDATGDTCNLSGYTSVSAYCGRDYNDSGATSMAATFIDSDNQESDDGDESGTIRIEMTETQTSALSWTSGYYDVYLTEPSGDRIRILQGQMSVRPKVTSGTA